MKHTNVGVASDISLLHAFHRALQYTLTPKSLCIITFIPNLIYLSFGSFPVPEEVSPALVLSSHFTQEHLTLEANIDLREADTITRLLSSLTFSSSAFHMTG